MHQPPAEQPPPRETPAAPANARLLEALARPEAYPQRPESIGVLQTHVSMLFFAGEGEAGRVYKVKKAVDLGFIDATTIEKRKFFCEEEVRLNRRLAPDVYLGVRPIIEDDEGGIRIVAEDDPQQRVIDYAVEMRRLPADRMLDALLETGAIEDEQLDDIADLLVEFHRHCPTGPGVDEHAAPEALRGQVRENCAEMLRLAESTAAKALIEHVQSWLRRTLDERRDLFAQRISGGRIREGHGDLHAGNICLLEDGRIVIYDCIEFTPRYRCRDVACELAFLAMDLAARGRREIGRRVLERYAAQAGDDAMDALVPFYFVHLAMVRAKVARLTSDRSLSVAAGYLHLAVGAALGPAMILMCGLPGTGKSRAAAQINDVIDAEVLRSDAIRKELAGLPPQHRPSDEEAARLYSSGFSDRTYNEVRRRAEQALQAGRSIIIDATLPTAARRARFTAVAEAVGVPWVLIHTTAGDDEVRRRMNARASATDEVSDADWAVYQRFKEFFQPPDEVDAARRVTGTPRSTAEALREAALLRLAASVRR